MKTQNYMKKREEVTKLEKLHNLLLAIRKCILFNRKAVACIIFLLFLLPIASIVATRNSINEAEFDSIDMITTTDSSIASSSSKKGVITIPNGMVKANPFVPYRDVSGAGSVNDIPTFNLVEPPETVNEGSEAARIMDTTVSGILYDKFSPSAILNIEGNDYLVKKGDKVNNYKIINITQDSVTVQLGSNTYKAGIGEILTEGTLNYNNVSNLNNKFGGVK